MTLRWEDGFTLDIHIRRRWFPWPTDNVTLGRTIFTRSRAVNDPTLRHEGQHCRQYHDRGWLWVLCHPTAREVEAQAAETAAWPQWSR